MLHALIQGCETPDRAGDKVTGPLAGPLHSGGGGGMGRRWRASSSLRASACRPTASASVRTRRLRPHTRIRQIKKRTREGSSSLSGGGGGIRTHGTEDRTLDFESSPFDHSGTPPIGVGLSGGLWGRSNRLTLHRSSGRPPQACRPDQSPDFPPPFQPREARGSSVRCATCHETVSDPGLRFGYCLPPLN